MGFFSSLLREFILYCIFSSSLLLFTLHLFILTSGQLISYSDVILSSYVYRDLRKVDSIYSQ